MLYWAIAGIILSEYVQLISDRGSFLDSIWGRSQCDSCKKEVPWYALIPFFGRFLSKGKCPNCGKKISWNYFIFEVLFSVGWILILFGLFAIGLTSVLILASSLVLYCTTALLMYEDYKRYSVPVSWLVSWIVFYFFTWWANGAGTLYYWDTLLILAVLGVSILVVYLRKSSEDRSFSGMFGSADLFVLVLFALLLGFQKTTWVLVFSMVGAVFFLLSKKRLKVGQRLPLLTVMLPWGIIALLLL